MPAPLLTLVPTLRMMHLVSHAGLQRAMAAVTILHWPRDRKRRRALAEQGIPRLLLIEPGATPPMITDPLEDWMSLPGTREEMEARQATLAARSDPGGHPMLTDGDVLRYRDGWVALSPVEARMIRAFVAAYDQCVTRADLATAAWPGLERRPNSLTAQVRRLRQRIAPLGLAVDTIHGHGYALTDGAGHAGLEATGA